MVDAVEFAHRAGVVHRDLKPGNILVSERGATKLLDFGIAKLIAGPGEDEETRTLGRAMTPAYASPEQVLGHRVTFASDVYSLGVVFYELVAGVRPFQSFSGNARALERAGERDEATAVARKSLPVG